MEIQWKVVIAVLIAMLVFKVLDVMFIDGMVRKNFANNYESDYEQD